MAALCVNLPGLPTATKMEFKVLGLLSIPLLSVFPSIPTSPHRALLSVPEGAWSPHLCYSLCQEFPPANTYSSYKVCSNVTSSMKPSSGPPEKASLHLCAPGHFHATTATQSQWATMVGPHPPPTMDDELPGGGRHVQLCSVPPEPGANLSFESHLWPCVTWSTRTDLPEPRNPVLPQRTSNYSQIKTHP